MLHNAKKRARVYSKLLYRKTKQNKGATAIEYGFIAALVALACAISLKSIGTDTNKPFSKIASTFLPP